MSRARTRAGAEALFSPHREPGEVLLGASWAWLATVTPGGHVFFVGRHRRLVVLTDRRLLAWRRSRPGTTPGLVLPLTAVRLQAEHPSKPFFQMLAATADAQADTSADTRLVIELRHRDHAFGRAIARALGHAAVADVAPAGTTSAGTGPAAG
jgi:hypothetical protein